MLATIGSAIGIGSIWKFPYEVGANGGGVFIVVYLVGLALVVIPLLFAEFAIGQRGGADSASSLARVAVAENASPRWKWVGLLGAVTCFLILSFYSVIGGWTLAYATQTLFHGLPAPDPLAVRERYDTFLASPWHMLAYHALFMIALAAIVMRGIRSGIEQTATILMPLLAILMLGLALYSMIEGDAARTLRFLFIPDLAHLTARGVLDALGLGFFSIGIGLGLMITYAAYGDGNVDLKRVALVSVIADTAISLLAGLAVFPIVFANGLDPASGPGLVFVTLPLAFANMAYGNVFAVAFFSLLFIAALASGISLLEGVVAVLGQGNSRTRKRAAVSSAAACFALGIPTVLSFNRWAQWHPLSAFDRFHVATAFDLIDYLTSNILLPTGGLGIALFAGRVISEHVLREELRLRPVTSQTLRVLLRFVAPIAIVLVTFAPAFA
jgi:NSS family neurotransmitter:Na+ symporter